MITDDEIRKKAEEFKITPHNVQRDYVFGWLLSGIYNKSPLGQQLILKGGNGLRKGYLEKTRFSKDLDFSSEGAVDPILMKTELNNVLDFVQTQAGVSFDKNRTKVDPKLIINKNQQIYEGRVYFEGFYGTEELFLTIQLDITEFDKIIRPIQTPELIHPYSDSPSCVTNIRCQKLEEILASKLKSILHRRKVSDLFDLVRLLIFNQDYPIDRAEVITTFLKKSVIYETNPQGAREVLSTVDVSESAPFWHEIVAPIEILFDFDAALKNFKELVEVLFSFMPEDMGGPRSVMRGGKPHSTIQGLTYLPAHLRSRIMKGGQTKTLVKLLYDNKWREAEPYAFEYYTPKTGFGSEYLWIFDRSGGNSGQISTKMLFCNKIEDVTSTNTPFTPQWRVEF